ncbi:MAG: sce7726 family protein [Brevundimonas sp.]|uniref:sce7726 family protein n=1 Tax=Brevundimonas sp. TaxID=1871086 RepID=UPI00391C197D
MTPSANILAATSRLFSSAVVRDLATKGRSALFARLVREAELNTRGAVGNVADVFEAAFAVLRMGASRDEYVYKAALTHKVLLGKHSLRTACMLNEFRAGNCKADMVILNGTATVYEIKSERDSLSRLERQLEAYRNVFPSVFVIAGENHVRSVLQMVGDDDGVLQLSRRHQISTIKPATDRPDRIDPVSVFESLRTDEARALLAGIGIRVPDVPNTRLHGALREKFEGLPPRLVHVGMVQVLKRKRDLRPLSDLIDQLPPSLQPAALSVPLRKADHNRLVRAVATPLGDALAWT